MKEVLEKFFGSFYGSTKTVEVISEQKTGVFERADDKACAGCEGNTKSFFEGCDQKVLRCDAGEQEVEVIELELFVANYNGLKKLRPNYVCDLLMVGDDKVVFCDLACYNPKYIDSFVKSDGTKQLGKRLTVWRQIENSIEKLTGVPEIADEILSKSKKIGLFAYRRKEKIVTDLVDRTVLTGMRSLIDPTKDAATNIGKLGKGFQFIEVVYPETYIWK